MDCRPRRLASARDAAAPRGGRHEVRALAWGARFPFGASGCKTQRASSVEGINNKLRVTARPAYGPFALSRWVPLDACSHACGGIAPGDASTHCYLRRLQKGRSRGSEATLAPSTRVLIARNRRLAREPRGRPQVLSTGSLLKPALTWNIFATTGPLIENPTSTSTSELRPIPAQVPSEACE